MFPVEIYQLIINYLLLADKLNFFQLNKFLYHNLKIYELDNKLVTQSIIEQNKFDKLKKLTVYAANKLISINHLCNLEILICQNNSDLSQEGIMNLSNLKQLFVSNNKITSVNHLNKLEILYCCDYLGINQNGIMKLVNLKKLSGSKIYDYYNTYQFISYYHFMI